ncbi:PREDICTED: snRNA-activating protein complex subunit 2 isoform X2 [Dipodomys ordii]|uniref:snRNA-activating protein complex subunit 2 isoform X2 n=1 Tax=Dipodomys ordii TaxID=10020 RepID=A0A1S3GJW3_DIPOR|nr:PREDICTED: snRNA-activating protein complex subunit 2 isoform X2 [Dipodomys ordii]
MKPPQRRRAAPARYRGEVTGPTPWNPREKRQLLRLLQARRAQPEPDAAELARELPSRTEAEVLTIAATEPLSLLHSKPPKPTKARGKLLLLNSTRGQDDLKPRVPDPTPEASGPTPGAPGTPSPSAEASGPDPVASTEGDFTVDFEKIYKYLSFSCRSGRSLELSAAESAVVLDLLLSLPEELSRLPCTALMQHMEETYARLTAPASQPNPSDGMTGPGVHDGETGLSRPDQVTSQVPEPKELKSAWQAAGICPLNPFLVPLELLGQVATTPAR